jgi:hypothetical protein
VRQDGSTETVFGESLFVEPEGKHPGAH